MAQRKQEQSENSALRQPDLRLYFSTLLSELAQNPDTNLDVLTQKISVLDTENDTLLSQANALLAVAIGHIDQLASPEYRQSLVSEYFPTTQEKLTVQLLELQGAYAVGAATTKKLAQIIANPDSQPTTAAMNAIGVVVRKVVKNPERPACLTIFEIFKLLWPNLGIQERKQVKNLFTQLRDALGQVDGVSAVELTRNWSDMLFDISQESDSDRPELIASSSSEFSVNPIETVLEYIPIEAIDAVGYALRLGANELVTIDQLKEKFSQVLKVVSTYPASVVDGIVEAYVDAGLITRYKRNRIKLSKKGQDTVSLGATELETVLMARRLFTGKTPKPKKRPERWEEISAHYEAQRERVAMPTKEIVIEGESRRIMFIGDVNIGHIAFDEDAADRFIEQLKNLPDDEKPHHIVISGLVAGGYHFRRKEMRKQLAITSMDQQFAYARLFLNKLLETGIEISYVLSSEDFEIARNYTIFAYQALDHLDNPQADPQKQFVPYWMADQMQMSDRWDELNEVQVNAAMHYYLRCGRRMRSADEVRQLNDGRGVVREEYRGYSEKALEAMPWAYVRQEEFFIFFDALDKLINGEELPLHYYDILEMEHFPIPGKVFDDFNCYNGLRLTSITDAGETVSYLHHNGLETSLNTPPKNPIGSFGSILGPLAVTGKSTPNEFVNFHGDFSRGAEVGEETSVGLLSTPGFSRSDPLDYRSQTLFVPGSRMARHAKYGYLPSQGGVMREVYGDGDHVVVYPMTTELMDWASFSSEQIAWLLFADNHFGSQAAYIDGLVRFLDYAFKNILANHPTVIAMLGDIIQGRNVRSMAQESAIAGLPSLEHMLELAVAIYFLSLSQGRPLTDLPPYIENILKLYMVTGNHEQNSLPREMQSDFLLPMYMVLNMLLTGFPYGGNKVERLQTMTSIRGDQIVYPGGITDTHGGINAFMTHVWDKRRFGGRDQIDSARRIAGGFGKDFAQVKLMLMGDRHVGLWGVPLPGILALVVGSMCWATGYELGLGLKSTPQATVLKIGGNRPPEIHYYSNQFIAKHQIQTGPFSDEYLADTYGIVTGPNYKPHHGLYNVHDEKRDLNAIQQNILRISKDIQLGNQSWLGPSILLP